ncbi:MAG: hypothetical protein L6408_01470 [Nanoarchaeota archaeon]|nr:hypothetical protein [Nanoarchaeota archaeon]
MKEITKIREKLDLIRGEVISSASRIGFILGYKLRKYFFHKTNNKATILFWNVINSPLLNFDKKINLYESIPYFKKSKNYQKIKESLRFIQKLRNIMAHWELHEKESSLKSIVMFTLVGKYRKITINDALIKDYRKHIDFIIKEFGYSR